MPASPTPPPLLARLGTLEALKGLGVEGLAQLIGERPDLDVPPWADLSAVARLVDSAESTENALAALDLGHTAVAYAACLVGPATIAELGACVATESHADDPAAVEARVVEIVDRLAALLLVARDDEGRVVARAGLDAAVPSPFGLGPALARNIPGTGPTADALRTACTLLGLDAEGSKPVLTQRIAEHHLDHDRLLAVLQAGPPGVAAILPRFLEGAMTHMPHRYGLGYGRQAGRFGTTSAPDHSAEDPLWFLADRLILLVADGIGILAREARLALLGMPVLELPLHLPAPATHPGPSHGDLAAASGQAALDLAGRVELLLGALAANPPQALAGGPLGVREARKLAKDVGLDEHDAAFALELALAAGLVGPAPHPDAPPARRGRNAPPPPLTWVPTAAYDEWLSDPPAERIAALVASWWSNPRLPHLALRNHRTAKALPVFDEGARARSAPTLRAILLAVLAQVPEDDALDQAGVLRQIGWLRPGNALALAERQPVDPDDEVDDLENRRPWTPEDVPQPNRLLRCLLDELATLGLVIHGAPTPALRVLAERVGIVAGGDPEPPSPVPGLDDDDLDALVAAFESSLPATTNEVTFLGDLTAIVAGTPTAALRRLLADTTEQVSTGPATVHRFSEATLRRALDAGQTADSILSELDAVAGGRPLPAALVDVVREAGRRHGRVRVVDGAATVLVVADEPLGIELSRAKKLTKLGLELVAPTVLVSTKAPAVVLDALRAAGHLPTVSGPGGVVRVAQSTARAEIGRRRTIHAARPPDDADRLALAKRLLEGRQGDTNAWMRRRYADDDDLD